MDRCSVLVVKLSENHVDGLPVEENKPTITTTTTILVSGMSTPTNHGTNGMGFLIRQAHEIKVTYVFPRLDEQATVGDFGIDVVPAVCVGIVGAVTPFLTNSILILLRVVEGLRALPDKHRGLACAAPHR